MAAQINATTLRDAESLVGATNKLSRPRAAVVLIQSLDPRQSAILNTLKQVPQQSAAELGGLIDLKFVELAPTTTQQQLSDVLSKLSRNPDIHGISLQRPLPGELDAQSALELVLPVKDIDGLHPSNIGLYHMRGCAPVHVPCAAEAFLRMLRFYDIDYKNPKCRIVIVGSSNTVGRRIAEALLREGAIVTHFGRPLLVEDSSSSSSSFREIIRAADVVITTVGIPQHFGGDSFKRSATVFDFGVNPVPDPGDDGFRMVGDVNFEEAQQVVAAITPPGREGMFPVTSAVLFENVLRAYKLCSAGHAEKDVLSATSFLWGAAGRPEWQKESTY